MWKPGNIVAWRGIYRGRIWHANPMIVVKDSFEELVLTLLPDAECFVEETYSKGKMAAKRRWDFRDTDWKLARFPWRTNRLLILLEPDKFYSIMQFWHHASNEFLGYYINFQLPFKRSHCGIDTLDLDLDIDIDPDLNFKWKDLDDYQKAIDNGIIFPEWVQGIEVAKQEILDRLEKRQYPFDGSWLNWRPDPGWSPPTLPENWDKIGE